MQLLGHLWSGVDKVSETPDNILQSDKMAPKHTLSF